MKSKRPQQNPILKAVYLETVDNQLRDNDPPETRQTLDRLHKEGFSDKDAKVLIASAIAAETYYILKNGEPFNRERFIRNLQRLPDQSFDNG
ncbi:MAG: hypothetical protein ABSF91_12985 [Bacteroidota bacterium]|jgi:hypothetical protein